MKTVSAVRAFWQLRNSREQAMLGVMFAMLGAAIFWYGLVHPLLLARDAARAHHERAVRNLHQVEANARRISVLLAIRPPTPTGALFASTILESAQRAELPISRQRRDAQDALVVDIDRVEATVLFDWLESLRREHGIGPQALTVSKLDGRLRAQISFATNMR